VVIDTARRDAMRCDTYAAGASECGIELNSTLLPEGYGASEMKISVRLLIWRESVRWARGWRCRADHENAPRDSPARVHFPAHTPRTFPPTHRSECETNYETVENDEEEKVNRDDLRRRML
jgi:hypothetical protein